MISTLILNTIIASSLFVSFVVLGASIYYFVIE